MVAAPIPSLKLLQRRLSTLLYGCLLEKEQAAPHRKQGQFGYMPDRWVADNAERHRSKRFVLNVDLEDFFGSFNFGRVRGYFIADSAFSLNPDVATTIAQIACWKNSLPQGSPSSPIISSLIGGILDRQLAVLAKRYNCTYTRYVDDLTFSTNQRVFPTELAYFETQEQRWREGVELNKAIEKAGFKINSNKTRLFSKMGRQSVTGLVVNKIVNVNRQYEMRARAAVDRYMKLGWYQFDGSLEKKANNEPPEVETSPERLEGVLQWIYSVRDHADLREDTVKRRQPTSYRKLYREFLFARHFLYGNKPVVICEGKTDNVYISMAIRSLAAKFPELGEWDGDKFRQKIRLFKYNKKSRTVLHLAGGSGDLSLFVRDYRRLWARTSLRKVTNPVIIVVDNDDGGKQVFKAVKDVGGPDITVADPKILHHAFNNLFIIKTPTVSDTATSCIEDLFTAETLNTKLGEKTFDAGNEGDTVSCYGKNHFAEYVIRPHWKKVDFSGFDILLTAISEATSNFSAS